MKKILALPFVLILIAVGAVIYILTKKKTVSVQAGNGVGAVTSPTQRAINAQNTAANNPNAAANSVVKGSTGSSALNTILGFAPQITQGISNLFGLNNSGTQANSANIPSLAGGTLPDDTYNMDNTTIDSYLNGTNGPTYDLATDFATSDASGLNLMNPGVDNEYSLLTTDTSGSEE